MMPPWLLLVGALAHAQPAPEPVDAAQAGEEEELPPLVKMPELLEFVQAPYPPEAKEQGLAGTVLLLIEIEDDGAVSHVEVLVAAGSGFDQAAVDAAGQFVFSPAEDTEGPVPVAIEFEYGFVLDVAEVEGAVPEVQEPVELPVNVQGTILEMATRRQLEDMAVSLMGTEFVTQTNAEGAFEFRGVPAGTYTLSASRPGWVPREAELEVLDGEATTANIWVKNESYNDDAAVGVYRRQQDEISRHTISMNEVRRIPGTFGDPVRVIQNLPGAARSPFGSGLLIIRGSNPEDSGVYVDGIRVPYIYHIGGYVSILNPDLVESVDYLPGNFGVQYGRSMGGVVDVRTKAESPEQARLTWSTDFLDSGGMFEGRLGESQNHHIGVAARTSYVDRLLPLVPSYGRSGFTVSPRWTDYQVRYGYTGLDRTRLTLMVFGFDDRLLLGTPDGVAQGPDQDTQDDLSVRNYSHRVIATMEHQFSDQLSMRVVPSWGYDYAYLGAGQAFGLEQAQRLWEVRAELPWTPSPKLEIVPGVDLLWGSSDFSFQAPISPGALLSYDPLAEREDFYIDGTGRGWGPDLYLKALWRPLDDPDALLIAPGIRASVVVTADENWGTELATYGIDPRISARARVLPQGFVKAATGIYTQPPQPFEAYHPNPNVQVDLGMERAWSSAIGYEHQLTQGLGIEVEGFYKHLTDLIIDNPELSNLSTDQYNLNAGVGRIYGAEVMLRQAPVNKVFGWLSYTLSRSERKNSEKDEDWYLFDFDQTHILTAVAGYKLPWEFEVSGRFQYVTGNPYTFYEGAVYDIDQDFYFPFSASERNDERLPAYSALDLRIDKGFTFKKWRLSTYLDLLNVYRGENPEFVRYNYDYTEWAYVRGLPFVPSLGVDLEVYL